MYVVTNRQLDDGKKGLALFGDTPNNLGPNELRLVKVIKRGSGYSTELLEDRLAPSEVEALKQRHALKTVDPLAPWYASLRVACEIMARAQQEQRHVLVYVHGYNNDMADVLKTAEELEALYKVIVVPFSWPANGGGPVSGTADYLDDKRDARVSMDALNRFVEKAEFYHALLTESYRDRVWDEASRSHPTNPGAAREAFSARLARDCQVTLNLICHSMGNYVLKYAVGPSSAATRDLVFDNVCLAAADANNPDHPQWVERIQVRNRLYIVINEDDYALAWSRRKPGQEQLERLGNYLRNLTARNAYYVDVTGAPWVKNAHGYFTGQPVEKNAALRHFFTAAFEGRRGEPDLRYAADVNAYRLR